VSAGEVKVGTLVLVIEGSAAGMTGEVEAHDPSDAEYSWLIKFRDRVPAWRDGVFVSAGNLVWHERRDFIPLTPPGQPEAETTALDRPVHAGYPEPSHA